MAKDVKINNVTYSAVPSVSVPFSTIVATTNDELDDILVNGLTI